MCANGKNANSYVRTFYEIMMNVWGTLVELFSGEFWLTDVDYADSWGLDNTIENSYHCYSYLL